MSASGTAFQIQKEGGLFVSEGEEGSLGRTYPVTDQAENVNSRKTDSEEIRQ